MQNRIFRLPKQSNDRPALPLDSASAYRAASRPQGSRYFPKKNMKIAIFLHFELAFTRMCV